MPIGNPIGRTNNVASKIISVDVTSAQTTFTVQGGYRVNAIGVFRNGVRLANNNDYTANDGSTVNLNQNASPGDVLTFEIFDDFKVSDAIVSAASTQTIYGNLAVNGNIYADNFEPGVGEFQTDANNNVYTFCQTSLSNVTTGCQNFIVGTGGGNITSASHNNFLGHTAGCCNTTGCFNNFLGQRAGCSNTSGCYNHFFGNASGQFNTTGSKNIFIGGLSGQFNTTGIRNNFIGSCAGRCNTTGSDNNFLGASAGLSNSTGSYNNFLGYNAGRNNITGNNNNFLGIYAGLYNTSGSYNHFFGGNAGRENTTGSRNIFT